jgi:hypothetical protein
MAALSEADLASIIRNGDGRVPAFGQGYSEEDANAVAAYLRSLTFAESPAVASVVTPSTEAAQTDVTPEEGITPSAPSAEAAMTDAIPEDGVTPSVASAATPAAGVGVVAGTIDTADPEDAGGLIVTLHGFDHGQDQSSGPEEVLTLTSTIEADGAYLFEDVVMPPNRIFLAEVDYAGINYRSDFGAAAADSAEIRLPPLQLYEPSTDTNLLRLDQVHIYTDFATSETVQVLEVFAFTNNSDNAVVISTDGTSIPFIRLPDGASNQGYEAGQDSAPFVAADAGLAVLPSDRPYSIITFFNLPYEKSLDFRQPLALDSASVLLLVPDGIKVEGEQLSPRGLQVIQNDNYQQFRAAALKAGEDLAFTVSGRPRVSSATGLDAHQGWLIGGGFLGLALITGGIYLYVRDRRREPGEVPEAEFETVDEVLDAILALDDLQRAGKISDAAHQTRRDELKQALKDLH